MKRTFIIILLVIVAFILGWFVNEAYTFSKAMKADKFGDYQLKPKAVPYDAFWAGGVDGGNWYLVKEINIDKNKASIEVYSDHDGSLLLSKTFTLSCPAEPQISITNLKEQINGFDGEKIYLISKGQSKECYLQ